MKKLFSRSFVVLLIFVLALSSSSAFAATDHREILNTNQAKIQATTPVPSEAEAYSRMIALQGQYPEGMPWTNANEYTSKSSGYITYVGLGCVAFAYILSDAAFGDLPFSQHNDQNRIRVGDILRVNNNTHSVIVLEVRPTELVIAEGNYNSSIHWGRTLQRNGLVTDYIMTRYDPNSSPSIPSIPSQPQQPVDTTNTTPIYRLYNPLTFEHLYTSDQHESTELAAHHGWNDESIGWYAPKSGTPVYRIYNPVLADHLYTTDENEVHELTTSHGWQSDNNGQPLFYSGGNVDIYRMYNPITGRHHLTKDPYEYIVLYTQGWTPEGVKLNSVG